MIESVNNERVKAWAKLQDKKYRDETGLFLVEGEHLVEEANKCGNLKEVIVLEGNEFSYDNQTIVNENVMKKISSLTNVPKIIGIAEKLKSRDIRGNVLILDGVQDPGNLGTIIRSSIAFDIDTLVIGEGSVSLYNPKVVRASEGLLFHLNIIEANVVDVINELKEEGYTIYTTDVDGGTSLKKANFDNRCAIVVGNEGAGVSKEASSLADVKLYIDMNKLCESLNVGVATSIILYELKK